MSLNIPPESGHRGTGAEVVRSLGAPMSRYGGIPEWVHRLGRRVKSLIGLLWPTPSRSYWHGYLFDRQGGVYRTEKMEFEVPPRSMPRSYRSRFYFDLYELPERSLIKKYLRPDAVILEVGACIGVVSCLSNRLLADPSRHVVVEANPDLIATLQQNRDHNGCRFQIEHCIVGIGSEVTFHVNPLMTASRLGDRLGRAVTVKARTIDALQGAYNMKFDTLIADIEGGELSLIEDHSHLMPQLRTVVIEVHPSILGKDGANRVRNMLRNSGLTLAEELFGTEVWIKPEGITGERASASVLL